MATFPQRGLGSASAGSTFLMMGAAVPSFSFSAFSFYSIGLVIADHPHKLLD